MVAFVAASNLHTSLIFSSKAGHSQRASKGLLALPVDRGNSEVSENGKHTSLCPYLLHARCK